MSRLYTEEEATTYMMCPLLSWAKYPADFHYIKCQGSICMLWKWVINEQESMGYCGLLKENA